MLVCSGSTTRVYLSVSGVEKDGCIFSDNKYPRNIYVCHLAYPRLFSALRLSSVSQAGDEDLLGHLLGQKS